MKKQHHIQGGAHISLRNVHCTMFRAFSMCLLFILACSPLAPVFADELSSLNTATSPELTPAPEVNAEPETPPSQDTVTENIEHSENIEEVVTNEDTETEAPDVPEALNSEEPAPPVGESADAVPVDDALNDSTESTPTVPDELPVDQDTPLLTEPPTGTPEEEVLDGIETIVDTVPEDVTSEDVPEPPLETIAENVVAPEASTTVDEHVVNVVTNDENKFSFSKDECTTVGDGTFYCATASTLPQVVHTDRVFSAVDEEGDKEIYVEKTGELTKLTNNTHDDDAPYFDEVSNTAVWHRLIDGRYQIIQYNFDDETETQLTNDSFNNMQPSVFGDTLVWQGWVGNDWEIFIEVGGERKMLTDNTTHDIAPSVNGTHVVWQSFENEAWRMKVYDIRTGLIDTVEDSGGGSIENPRFVLVYDAKMETGDIETRGYDLKSGEVLDLASRPTPVPEEIPDPDQTGEKRALVAPSTQPKPKTDSDENDDVGTTTASGTGNPDDGDLVIPSLEESGADSSTDTASSTSTDSSDVVIPSFDTGTSTSVVDHIEDLVVEPYVPLDDVLQEESRI